MPRSGSHQKVANSLVVMSSAAVLAVYSAGFVRTRSAADRIDKQAVERAMARRAPPNDMTPIGMAPIGLTAAAAAVPESTPATAQPESKHAAPQHTKIVAPGPAASPAPEKAAAGAPSAAPVPLAAATPEPVSTIASAPAPPVPATPKQPVEVPSPAPKAWKDGKYVGWGGSRHGDIQATIVIEGGRIVSAAISDCETRYPCDVIERLPPQVLMRQSPNVDRVGGATESADAFYSAVYFALQQAQ